ncbi:MAG: hypothetical protein D6820_02415, partial [Lentisphaerae bacterium]
KILRCPAEVQEGSYGSARYYNHPYPKWPKYRVEAVRIRWEPDGSHDSYWVKLSQQVNADTGIAFFDSWDFRRSRQAADVPGNANRAAAVRHRRFCQTVMFDGHVSRFRFSDLESYNASRGNAIGKNGRYVFIP